MIKHLLFAFVLSGTIVHAQTTLFSEGFDTFSNLATNGWTQTNQSSPLGTSTWAQGGGTAFSGGGQSGGTTSFTLCNFNSTTGTGTISNWLITPVISVQNGDVFSFYTRKGGTGTGTIYADRLEFRLSTNGASSATPSGATSVGDFSIVGVSVNPNLTTSTDPTTGYPIVWTLYSYTISGFATATDVKAAFRYYVTNGGPDGTHSDIIGVDTYSVVRPILGVEDIVTQKDLVIYPTVVKDSFTISLLNDMQIKGISIYDMTGKSTGMVKADVYSNNQYLVDASNMSAGVYLVKVITNKGQFTSKLIKK